MPLKASQRGGGKQLGQHLSRTDDNEHMEVHEIRGFVSDDVTGAFKEAFAVSKGTHCKQFLFSVSDSRAAFENVLSERGMMLAKGDRREFVALTPEGEVLSVGRFTSKKEKEVRAKFGSPDNLPSVAEAREKISSQMGQTVKKHFEQAHIRKLIALTPLEQSRLTMTNAHRHER